MTADTIQLAAADTVVPKSCSCAGVRVGTELYLANTHPKEINELFLLLSSMVNWFWLQYRVQILLLRSSFIFTLKISSSRFH